MNGDSYDDIAIGAPYHDSTGAVYIYMGSEKGISATSTPAQKISPKSTGGISYKNFGCSLGGGIDVDENGFNDLIVGAYGAESVLLYRFG